MTEKSVQHILRLIEDPSFRSWCVGKATAKEHHYWQKRIAEDKHLQQFAPIAKQIVIEIEESSDNISANHKFAAWEELAEQIYVESEIQQTKKYRLPRRQSYKGWFFVAAASVMLLIISFVMLKFTGFISSPNEPEAAQQTPEWHSISTDYAENKNIRLDNGTEITLNSNSTVSYAEGWVLDDTLSIKLKGEAYFDVKRRSERDPVFQVETTDGNVSVLGTRFMVNTWNNRTQVVLEEGEVAIDTKANRTTTTDAIVQPNELAEFSLSSKEVNIKNVNTELFTSWTKGVLVFDRTPLIEVANRIEKIFGKKVLITDPALLAKKVSGSVESNNINVITSSIAKSLQISVAQNENQIVFKNIDFGIPIHN